MTSAIAAFQFESQELRFVGTAEQPEWVAADAVAILYPGSQAKDRSNYLKKVPTAWKGMRQIQTLGGLQELVTLYEPGLYHLICRSDSPLAVPFQRWVFEDVLPSIRKTGGYGNATPQNPFNHPEVKELLDAVKDKEMNLSALEIRLLTFLRETGAAGRDGITLEEAMATTGIHQSTFYRAVKRFQEFGLVEPQPPVTRYRFRNLRAMGMLEEVDDA